MYRSVSSLNLSSLSYTSTRLSTLYRVMPDDETTDEEKLQIAQHFLLSSPPGQFKLVLEDVNKLLPDGLLSDSLVAKIAKIYNNKNGKVVTAPSGKKVALNAAGEVGGGYLDISCGTVFSVDHTSLATSECDSSYLPDPAVEGTRAALQTEVSAYLADKYSSDESAGCVYAKDGKMVVILTGEKANLKNFWSGKWNSVWTISVNAGEAEVAGEIKILAHYFEDGNMQLNTSKPVSAKKIGSAGSDADLAKAIVAHITEAESAVQMGLESMYANMGEQTLRAMRRVMPITRNKMEWNVFSVRMVRQTQAGKKA